MVPEEQTLRDVLWSPYSCTHMRETMHMHTCKQTHKVKREGRKEGRRKEEGRKKERKAGRQASYLHDLAKI